LIINDNLKYLLNSKDTKQTQSSR